MKVFFCKNCNQELQFEKPSHFGGHVTTCKKLQNNYGSIRKKNNEDSYNKNPQICKECNILIEYNNRSNDFCSHSCSAKFYNKINIKDIKIIHCKICQKQTSNHKIFCSKECNTKNRINKLQNNELKSGAAKQVLIIKNGEKCMKCGWCQIHPITNKVPIELNHIDGDANNNSLENLELLCPNCHSLTHNFRALNKKSSRVNRYKTLL